MFDNGKVSIFQVWTGFIFKSANYGCGYVGESWLNLCGSLDLGVILKSWGSSLQVFQSATGLMFQCQCCWMSFFSFFLFFLGNLSILIASRVENYWPHIHVGSFFYSIFLGRNRILVLLVFYAPIVSYFVRRNKFTWVGAWVSFFF